MPDGLRLQVGADTQAATKALDNFAKTAVKDAQQAQAALTQNLNKVTPALNNLNRSLGETSTQVAKTKTNFTAFTRVIQDLPFGFIAIQNNLEQLVPAAGAMGFVFSGLVSALTFSQTGLNNWSRSARGAGSAAKEAGDNMDDLLRPIEDIRQSAIAGAGEELGKVNALANAVLNQSLSYKERNNALNQLKEINKSYFGDLDLESSKLGVLRQRVDEYTQAIIQQAIIKEFSDQIGKVNAEMAKQQKILDGLQGNIDRLGQKYKDAKKTIADAGEELKKTGNFQPQRKAIEDLGQITTNIGRARKELQGQQDVVGLLRNQFADLNIEINKAVELGLQFKPLVDPKTGKDVTKDAKKFLEAMQRLRIEASKVITDIAPPGDKDIFQQQLTRLQEGIQKGIIDNGPVSLDVPIQLDAQFQQNAALVEEFTKEFQKVGGEIPPIDMEAPVTVNLKILNKELAKAKFANEMRKILKKGLEDLTSSGFASIGEGIGQALAGGDIQKSFKSFLDVIAGGIQAIGKQMIALGVAALLAKKALKAVFSNPAIAIAAGVALVAVGAAMKQALSGGVKGFAEGGLVSGPTLGLVGEGRGTNRSNPEVIAPLDKLKSLIGGNSNKMRVEVVGRFRGNDIVLSNARTVKQNAYW